MTAPGTWGRPSPSDGGVARSSQFQACPGRRANRESEEGELDERLGDRLERAGDHRGMVAQIAREPVAGELLRERQRREERRHDRRVPDPTIEAEANDRLDLSGVAGRGGGIEDADLLPVLSRAHRTDGARSVAVLADSVALNAPPGLDGIATARGDLEEVRAVPLVEPERRLRQARGRVVHAREMSPDRVRDAVDGLAVDRRENAFAPTHLLHARSTPSLSTGSPRSSTASNASRSPARPPPRTVKVDGMNTGPGKRAAISLTRAGSPSRSCRITCDTASASVAEPCKIGALSPAEP